MTNEIETILRDARARIAKLAPKPMEPNGEHVTALLRIDHLLSSGDVQIADAAVSVKRGMVQAVEALRRSVERAAAEIHKSSLRGAVGTVGAEISGDGSGEALPPLEENLAGEMAEASILQTCRKNGWRVVVSMPNHGPDITIVSPTGKFAVLRPTAQRPEERGMAAEVMREFARGFAGLEDTRFDSPEELATWLDGLHCMDGSGTAFGEKWEPAQRAIAAIRGRGVPPTNPTHICKNKGGRYTMFGTAKAAGELANVLTPQRYVVYGDCDSGDIFVRLADDFDKRMEQI